MDEFRRSEITLQGGFAFAIVADRAEGSFHAPSPGSSCATTCRCKTPCRDRPSRSIFWARSTSWAAPHGQRRLVLVAMPLPQSYAGVLRDIENSQNQYRDLRLQRRRLRRTYLGFLLLLTVGVLFASTWLRSISLRW